MINKIFQNFFRILAIAAFGTVGYLNVIVVPTGHTVLLVDQTDGVQKPYLKPGYHWNWTGFVPQKWKLYTIDMAPPPLSVKLVHYLPYTEYLKQPEKYAYHINIKIQFKLSDKSLDYFWHLLDDNINNYTKNIEEILKLHLQTVMLNGLKTETTINGTNIFLRTYFIQNRGVETAWNDIFPKQKLDLIRYEVLRLDSPDQDRYENQIKDIDRILEAEKNSVIHNITAQSRLLETSLKNQADLDKAQKFSKMIRNNPAILEYYKIEKINPEAQIYVVPQNFYGNSNSFPSERSGAHNGSDVNRKEPVTEQNHGVLPSFESGQK